MGEHKHKHGPNGAERAIDDKRVPIDCYRSILCSVGAANPMTGCISYLEVQESVVLPKDLFGKRLPLQAHFNLTGTGDYDVRIVWTSEEGGATCPAGDGYESVTLEGRTRFNSTSLQMPTANGVWSLALEWRHKGEDEWRASNARCPVFFASVVAPVQPVARA